MIPEPAAPVFDASIIWPSEAATQPMVHQRLRPKPHLRSPSFDDSKRLCDMCTPQGTHTSGRSWLAGRPSLSTCGMGMGSKTRRKTTGKPGGCITTCMVGWIGL